MESVFSFLQQFYALLLGFGTQYKSQVAPTGLSLNYCTLCCVWREGKGKDQERAGSERSQDDTKWMEMVKVNKLRWMKGNTSVFCLLSPGKFTHHPHISSITHTHANTLLFFRVDSALKVKDSNLWFTFSSNVLPFFYALSLSRFGDSWWKPSESVAHMRACKPDSAWFVTAGMNSVHSPHFKPGFSFLVIFACRLHNVVYSRLHGGFLKECAPCFFWNMTTSSTFPTLRALLCFCVCKCVYKLVLLLWWFDVLKWNSKCLLGWWTHPERVAISTAFESM